MSQVGRNDPCSCGSGRKAKHCCLSGKGPSDVAQSIVISGVDGIQPRSVAITEAVLMAQSRQQQGDMAGAEKIYKQILALDANHGDSLFYLGVLFHQMGRTKDANYNMRRALTLHPKVFKYLYTYGTICDELNDLKQACEIFRRAIEVDARGIAYCNLAVVLNKLGEVDEAAECCRKAIKLLPHYQNGAAYNNLAGALQQQGKLEEAVENFSIAVTLSPNDLSMASNYLYTLNFLSNPNLASNFQAHKNFGALVHQPLPARIRPSLNESARRPLRIGYVSPDFRTHSVSFFIEPILAHHDKNKFEVFCYYNFRTADETTARLKNMVPHWRLIHNRQDEEVAQRIREDGIDILVDLSGHTAENSLAVFGMKPAPIQVAWIGYPNTTGLSTMDYRITDSFADPVGEADTLHTETLWRLPECFSCFQMPTNTPNVGPLPALAAGHVTFGSFNNFAKTTPQVIATWARILKQLPSARMVLKNRSLGAKHVQAFILSHFAKGGVLPEQIVMLGSDMLQGQHMERYNTIDIGLDPFPYNGTTTTIDAMWMGVPMVVLSGRTHVGRVGVSQMKNMDLPEFIARDESDYVKIAVDLANDLPRLVKLRASLRERLRASPLMNAPHFTHNLEQAYEAMWKKYCAESAV